MNFRLATAAAAWLMLCGLRQTAQADALAALGVYAAAERNAQEWVAPRPARQRAQKRGILKRRFRANEIAPSLLFPIPTGAWLSSPWGLRHDPFTGWLAWHGGVDLAADAGTPVVAAHSGWCTRRYNRGSGLIVRIGSPRVVTEYRHLSSILAAEGPIRAGETIGRVGSTGCHSTGPHLHYALWINGRPVDPLLFYQRQWKHTPHMATFTFTPEAGRAILFMDSLASYDWRSGSLAGESRAKSGNQG